VQRLLAQSVDLQCLAKTKHFENESLYWTKAASVLGMPQQDMLDSEVPIPQAAARQDLITLLQENLPEGDDLAASWLANELPDHHPALGTQQRDKSLVFEGWRRLCQQYEPIFLEKSPHHLLQWSSLSLITECIDQLEGEVDFLLIGLVRNPMDTLYSAFRRWKTPPEKLQYEWLKSYTHLRQLTQQLGLYSGDSSGDSSGDAAAGEASGRVVIVRYEDLATSLASLQPVFDFCQAQPNAQTPCLNRKSLLKWQQDKYFGFTLAPEVQALAEAYGYTPTELTNRPWRFWPLYRDLLRGFHQSTRWAKALYIRLTLTGR